MCCVQLPMPSVMQAPLFVNVQYCGGGGGLADPGGAGGEKRLYGLPEVTVHSCCDVVDAQIVDQAYAQVRAAPAAADPHPRRRRSRAAGVAVCARIE